MIFYKFSNYNNTEITNKIHKQTAIKEKSVFNCKEWIVVGVIVPKRK